MPLPLMAAGAALGAIGAIGEAFGRKKANKEMGKLMQQDPKYSINPIAQQRLGLAQTLLNARMPGSAAMERNIYGNQANTMANASRNATDSSQLLALGAAAQGQTNQAFQNLQQAEAQNYQQNLQNLNQAQQGMIQEGDKVFDDEVRRFGNKVQFKGAQQANKQAGWQSLSNLGSSLMSFGMGGGMESMFGGGAGAAAGGGMSEATRSMLRYGVQNPLYGG